MIRIETTAEFGTDGHFTVTGKSPQPLSPGIHRATIVIDEPVTPKSRSLVPGEDTGHPLLEWEDGVLVWTGPIQPGLETAHRDITDERERQIVEGPWE
jgi:hypothetical protein